MVAANPSAATLSNRTTQGDPFRRYWCFFNWIAGRWLPCFLVLIIQVLRKLGKKTLVTSSEPRADTFVRETSPMLVL